ncbi:MAG: hypothetical protein M5T61_17495 [Acidimicrobiia bacterium]|nr:hypothetical protein [Acidimicrobiia bacterium]
MGGRTEAHRARATVCRCPSHRHPRDPKKGESFDPDLAYLVLDASARATSPPRPEEASLFDFSIAQILAALDAAGFDEDKLADLEWVFVRILERDPEGLKHLYRRLARDPRSSAS